MTQGKTVTTMWSYNVKIPQPPVKAAGENFATLPEQRIQALFVTVRIRIGIVCGEGHIGIENDVPFP